MTSIQVGKLFRSELYATSALVSDVCCVRTVKINSSSALKRGAQTTGPYSGSSRRIASPASALRRATPRSAESPSAVNRRDVM